METTEPIYELMNPNPSLESLLSDDLMQALLAFYEDARIDGLCHEGAWEVALSKMPGLDVSPDVLSVIEQIIQASG